MDDNTVDNFQGWLMFSMKHTVTTRTDYFIINFYCVYYVFYY